MAALGGHYEASYAVCVCVRVCEHQVVNKIYSRVTQAIKRLIEAGVSVDTKKKVTHITDRARVNEGA